MSTASRIAWTSCGVIWTLPSDMRPLIYLCAARPQDGTRASSPPQRDDRGAVAPFVRGAFALAGDGAVAAQVLAHRLAQPPRAVAVDDADLAPGGEQRLVQVAVEQPERRLDAHADQVEL